MRESIEHELGKPSEAELYWLDEKNDEDEEDDKGLARTMSSRISINRRRFVIKRGSGK